MSESVKQQGLLGAACKIWVHDDAFSREAVLFNASAFPQIQLTDNPLLKLAHRQSQRPASSRQTRTSHTEQSDATKDKSAVGNKGGFVFLAKDCDADTKAKYPNLQVSVSNKIARLYGFAQNMELSVTIVDRNVHSAHHIEICFRDVYLTRADLQRLVSNVILHQALFEGQNITFLGTIRATIKALYIHGKRVRSALFATHTKPIFRSESARYVLYIQMSREMWDFDTEGSGEIVFNKVIKSILPELFRRWSDLNARHLVSVVLFTRLEASLANSSSSRNSGDNKSSSTSAVENQTGRDFYRVVVGDMSSGEWEQILYELKKEFKSFLKDILLARSETESAVIESESDLTTKQNSISARPAPAMEGNILEAINLASSRFSSDWLDSDFFRSGLSVIVISPGPGFFEVDQDMLQLTTENLVKNGVGIDLLCLSERPLHEVPVFGFRNKAQRVQGSGLGIEASGRQDDNLKLIHSSSISNLEMLQAEEIDGIAPSGYRDQTTPVARRWTFVVPQWIQIHFWSAHSENTFESPRFGSNSSDHIAQPHENHFIPKCRMYEVQMTGIMENEMSNISVPNLHIDKAKLRDKALREFSASSNSSSRKSTFFEFSPSSRYLTQKHPKLLDTKASQRYDQLPKDFDDVGWMDEYDKFAFTTAKPNHAVAIQPATSRSDEQNGRQKKPLAVLSEIDSLSRSPVQANPQRPNFLHRESFEASNSQDSAPRSQPSLGKRDSRESIKSQSRMSTAPILPFSGRLRASGKAVASTQYNTEAVTSMRTPFEEPITLANDEQPGTVSQQVKKSLSRHTSTSVTDTGSIESRPASSRATPMDVPQAAVQKPTRESEKPNRDLTGRQVPVNRVTKAPAKESIYGQAAVTKQLLNPDLVSDSEKVLSAWLPLSNASRPGNMLAGMASNLGWAHTFVKPNQEFGIKWKSICSPAMLPLMSDYVPSEQLLQSYEENAHKITIPDDDLTSNLSSARALLLSRMVSFRLAKGFQLLPSASSSPAQSKRTIVTHFGEDYFKEDGVTVYMSKGGNVHTLCATGSDIQVTRYRPHDALRSLPTSRLSNLSFRYNPYIKTTFSKEYEPRDVAIATLPNQLNWSVIDNFLAGYMDRYTETCGFWRTRYVLIPIDPPSSARRPLPVLAEDSDDEVHIEGIQRLTQLWYRARYTPGEIQDFHANPPKPKDINPNPLGLEFQTRDISAVLTAGLHDFLLQDDRGGVPSTQLFSNTEKYRLAKVDLRKLAADLQSEKGIKMQDRRWHFRLHRDCFVGLDLTSWLLYNFQDVSNREEATDVGQSLMEKGLFKHVSGRHKFRDGNFFYAIATEYHTTRSESRGGWFSRRPEKGSLPSTPNLENSNEGSGATTPSLASSKIEARLDSSEAGHATPQTNSKRPIVRLSSALKCDVDPRRRSDRPELVNIHYDRLYNPDSCYHFRLEWMETTPKLVEDAIASWASTAERYGLRLVQIPIAEAHTITETNPFRSPYLVELAIPPPVSKFKMSLDASISSLVAPPANDKGQHFLFHRALLRKFGFVLDIEAASNYPADVDITFSWGRQKLYKYSQFIHRTGVILAQVTDTGQILLLANRLAGNRSTLARDAARYDKRENRDERATPSQPSPAAGANHEYQRPSRPGSSGAPRRSLLTSPTIAAGRKRDHVASSLHGDEKDSKAAMPTAEQIRDEIEAFCSDASLLMAFYDELSGRDATLSARSTPILVGRDSSLLASTTSTRAMPVLDAAIPKLELPTVSRLDALPRPVSALEAFSEEPVDVADENAPPDEAG